MGWGTGAGLVIAAGLLGLAALQRSQPATTTPPPTPIATSRTASVCLPPELGVTPDLPPIPMPRAIATSPARPGQQLVLSATSAAVQAGNAVTVRAQLIVPAAVIGASGSARPSGLPTPPDLVLAPCVSLVVAGATVPASPVPSAGSLPAQPGSGVAVLVVIPLTTPPGSTVTVVASVPAGVPYPGSPPLSASLAITVI
jgi:hypothetical protein